MGSYTPPADEYLRPSGRTELKPKTYVDNHYVRGASFHSENFVDCRSGDVIQLELVPEPGNPYDRWAVALHLEGRRVGYISAEDSGLWHDIVFAYNRAGSAVLAEGIVHTYGEDTTGLTVLLPGFEDAETLMSDLGLFQECDAVIAALPEEARDRILDSERYGLSASDVRLLRSKKHLAPSLNWHKSRGSRLEDRYPTALYRRLIELDQLKRARMWEEKQAARQEARLERERLKQETRDAKAAAQEAFVERVKVVHASGASMSAMCRDLGCSASRIKRVLSLKGLDALPKQNQVAKDERMVRAQQALRLQQGGYTRNQIAGKMDCSFETVKSMLKDAKFYADPWTDLERLHLVRASKDPSVISLSFLAAASSLRVTQAKLKSARRDFSIISKLHPKIMES
jgi:hypothetical protein